ATGTSGWAAADPCMSFRVRNVAMSVWSSLLCGAALCAHATVVSTRGASSPAAATPRKTPSHLRPLLLTVLSVIVLLRTPTMLRALFARALHSRRSAPSTLSRGRGCWGEGTQKHDQTGRSRLDAAAPLTGCAC